MKNRIDLKDYSIRTDLLIENISDKKKDCYIDTRVVSDSIKVCTVLVKEEMVEVLKRKKGSYVTILFEDVTNDEDRKEVTDVFCEELKGLLESSLIQKDAKGLIVGLGNSESTADSLGPKTIDKVLVTRHLFELQTNVKEGIRNVSAISPGVMANTGIETFDIITSLIEKIRPDFLIVVDSLASSSIDRINKTIQITDTGINPGSGVGNNRKEISLDTVGIPVIAIGVPTVVESSIIVNDTISYLFKHLFYIKNNYAKNKLVVRHNKNYLDEVDNDLSEDEKREVSGLLGELDEADKRELINEVLNSLDYNMIVTPKEIDFLVNHLSMVLAKGIDRALHREVN